VSFEKPTAILFHDPVFLAIFAVASVALLVMGKKTKIRLNTASLLVLFFVLLVIYVAIRRVYE
jgi:4-amino-4-deoxy-L-arabinose transferase-like glycosyltransferase